ncbi:MAG: hypothetical protein QXS72_08560 [Candidatus Caldarchaeum sp.]
MVQIAEELGGEVVNVVTDYYGNQMPVISGVKAPGIRGFGVTVEDNQVKVVGDPYMSKIKLEDFASIFQQTYTAIAVRKSLAKLGYSVSTKKESKTVYVYGVKVW